MINDEKSYSVVNTHRSAIGQTLLVCTGSNIFSESHFISRFMKGLYEAKPPKPRYNFTWDVSTVLRYLCTLWPLEGLTLKLLTLRLTALLALSTAQRVQTINCFKLKLMSDFGDYVVFTIDELTKTSRPGRGIQRVKIDKFSNKNICVVQCLHYYIAKTKKLRKTDRLLISYKTHKEVTTSTIARWLKEVLHLSGIKTDIFSAHSYRGASTSCAFSNGFRLSDLLSTANWTNARTFHMFYHREKQSSYSNCVLSSMD